jgi:hypothetical protein
MHITSQMVYNTQIVLLSRRGLAHISQMSLSEMLQQMLHCFTL